MERFGKAIVKSLIGCQITKRKKGKENDFFYSEILSQSMERLNIVFVRAYALCLLVHSMAEIKFSCVHSHIYSLTPTLTDTVIDIDMNAVNIIYFLRVFRLCSSFVSSSSSFFSSSSNWFTDCIIIFAFSILYTKHQFKYHYLKVSFLDIRDTTKI